MSETPSEPAKAKSSKKLIPIVAAVLLVAGGGGGYFWYAKQAAAAAEAAAAEDDDEADADADDEDHGDAEADHRESEKKAKAKRKKKKAKAHGEHTTLMSFDPFVVNLADPNAARFLRTNVQLVVAAGEEGNEGGGGGHGGGGAGPTVPMMRARSAILELLSAQTSDELTTPEGKARLKEHIIERMEDVLEDTEVEDVLFSDFVIQF